MKDKNKSGNLLSGDDFIEKFDFDDEFDSELIANRGEGVDALSEDDFVEKGFKKKDSVFTKDDIEDIASQGKEAKKAADLYKQLTDDEETESALIKSEDAEKMEDIKSLYDDNHNIEINENDEGTDQNDSSLIEFENYDEQSDDEYEDYESIKHLLSDEEREKYENRRNKPVRKVTPEDIRKKKINEQAEFERRLFESIYSEEYKDTDEYRDLIMLEKQFEDIIKAPRIDLKKNASLESNLLETDEIKTNKKFVEITQAPNPDKPDETHQMSTVEINRDESGEIENIVVICKCGEKTLIKFDYQDDLPVSNTNNNTNNESDEVTDNIDTENTESFVEEYEPEEMNEDVDEDADDVKSYEDEDFTDDETENEVQNNSDTEEDNTNDNEPDNENENIS